MGTRRASPLRPGSKEQVSFSQSVSSSDHLQEYDDDGDDEQQMDNARSAVSKKADGPGNDQYYGNKV